MQMFNKDRLAVSVSLLFSEEIEVFGRGQMRGVKQRVLLDPSAQPVSE